MEQNKIKVELLPHTPFIKNNGKFDKKAAIKYSAKLAGECYEPEGWSKLKQEDDKKTENRTNLTLGLEHATPYEHINIGFEIVNLPKILAMILNNERQCSTSEKSARYTPIDANIDSNISTKEGKLYNKWMNIFRTIIKDKYGYVHNDSKIEKLAQENARYLVTVFASTKMIHTVPWIQLNRIVSYMIKYMEKENKNDFDERLIESFNQFINCFLELDVLDERAMSNRKERGLSLFAERKVEEHFGSSYSTNYKGSFAQLAQAHRHRTLEYNMELLDEKEYFIPPILLDNSSLVDEWLNDISSVAYANPQGEMISINECGTYDKFILKTKERLCSAAQQEIMKQTRSTLLKYKKALEESNHSLARNIALYAKGARCTFPDYSCANNCKFKEGKTLVRKI
ncbi:MAG: FAD-dependent thymidylate synthase [Bacilli bacterium]|nr:FAD-dependent thymidylate synthase [Bacilli bacterium]